MSGNILKFRLRGKDRFISFVLHLGNISLPFRGQEWPSVERVEKRIRSAAERRSLHIEAIKVFLVGEDTDVPRIRYCALVADAGEHESTRRRWMVDGHLCSGGSFFFPAARYTEITTGATAQSVQEKE